MLACDGKNSPDPIGKTGKTRARLTELLQNVALEFRQVNDLRSHRGFSGPVQECVLRSRTSDDMKILRASRALTFAPALLGVDFGGEVTAWRQAKSYVYHKEKRAWMTELLQSIAAKKERLDSLRPLPPEALRNLEHSYDIEITYSSNALEGNTLSAVETTLVIEQGVTIGGKPLKDHLEALDHYEAIAYVRELAREKAPLTESDVRNLHRLVMQRSRPDIAGRYADLARFVRTETGRYEFPSPAEIPALMGDFSGWIRAEPDMPDKAFRAHRRLVDIHPFNDGNGRTARILMNLFLIRCGYPPIAIWPEDRLTYIRALQQAQAGLGAESLELLLLQRLDATLTDYLHVLR